MKASILVTALTASSAAGLTVPKRDAQPELLTIQLSPTEIKQVTEEEKFALKAKGVNLMDITGIPQTPPNKMLPSSNLAAAAVTFPSGPTHQSITSPLLPLLSKTNLLNTLTPFTAFQNRFYKSQYGAQSSAWLLSTINSVIAAAGNDTKAYARAFNHTAFPQSSIIATLPGRTNRTIVLGAHQDSVNWDGRDQLNNRSPGADDNGSGSVTILEAMRVLLTNDEIRTGNAPNTIEFHWYAAEEGGLLGSKDVWQSYKAAGKDAKALLQQDMTGYSQGNADAGLPDTMGLIVDYVDTPLTEFIKTVIDEYCTISYTATECGYACSDHASASAAGYPSSFVFESDFNVSNPRIHTADDAIALLDFDHMIEHAKLTTAFAVELAYTETF
ncbi:leucine aminopeptidase [Periconia macrospinosa]|uniref:Peptide hydrolase n=1 Tax=Periconia macrospinosa TaxID=97972 RepID=A0A2V1D0D3_9PLEO|nr:leucine aminopeptidase [Periconia macrospinosa]